MDNTWQTIPCRPEGGYNYIYSVTSIQHAPINLPIALVFPPVSNFSAYHKNQVYRFAKNEKLFQFTVVE